jgi:HEPN domain-containing protein
LYYTGHHFIRAILFRLHAPTHRTFLSNILPRCPLANPPPSAIIVLSKYNLRTETMSISFDNWLEQAQYDIDTAKAMLSSRRYLYVLFCCQQAVEKMLKAIIARKTSDFPPRLHNLLRLAETAKLTLNESMHDFFGELSAYYIQSRYPEELQSLAKQVTPEIAADTLKKTEDALKWLPSVMP